MDNSDFDSQNMATDLLAGQRLMIGFDGTSLNTQLKGYIRDFKIGGLVLFSRNLETPQQTQNLCQSAKEYARKCGLPRLIISVDQEGGQVARLKSPYTEFAGNPFIKTKKHAEDFAKITASELLSAGFNMNLAPVVDVAPKNFDSVMAKRAFDAGPKGVGELGATVIKTFQDNGILAVAKHFPGIGRTTLDSHLDLPFCDTELSLLEAEDMVPFKAAIAASVSGIMLSHVVYNSIDPDWPASLSAKICNILRNEMGFSGIIMTDDFDMGAITKRFSLKIAINRFIEAGVDMALICHPGPAIKTAFEIIKASLDTAQSLDMGRAAVQRILAAKAGIVG